MSPYTKFCGRVSQNKVTPTTEKYEKAPQKNVAPITAIGGTNTEITTENKKNNYSNHINQSCRQANIDEIDEIKAYTDIVKNNIDYKSLTERYSYGEKDEIDEMVGLMVEIICVKRNTVRIAGENYPYELV